MSRRRPTPIARLRARAARLPAPSPGLVVALTAAAAALAPALMGFADADARPGGGHSYSGGSSRSSFRGGSSFSGGSSSSGDAGGALLYLAIRLVVANPIVGIPVLAIGGVVVWQVFKHKAKFQDWDASVAPAGLAPPPSADLDQIRTIDPEFSAVLFEDFVYRLYAQAHGARGSSKAMEELAPYLSPEARAALAQREPAGVDIGGVVVGAMRVRGVTLPPAEAAESGEASYVQVAVELEANMTDGQKTYFAVERWQLARAASARTKPQTGPRQFPCPNCAAPFSSADSLRCDYCGEVVGTGQFDWLVTNIALAHAETRPPSVFGSTPERGTDRPTITDPALDERWQELCAEDPATDGDALGARIAVIHRELTRAWSSLDLSGARPYVSDSLFDYLQYWVSAYRQSGARNVVDEPYLSGWVPARIRRDNHYDALTVRIWAGGKDYTIDQSGDVVGGNAKKDRPYSEYWTLIRTRAARGPAKADGQCPGCGAPLKVGMGGACDYCGAHVTSGEFDWVLSRIEQDDSYTG